MKFNRLLLILSTVFLGLVLSSNSLAASPRISQTLLSNSEKLSPYVNDVVFINQTAMRFYIDVTFEDGNRRSGIIGAYQPLYIDINYGYRAFVVVTNIATGFIIYNDYVYKGDAPYYINWDSVNKLAIVKN